ncbi:hypothetical protein RUM43_005028 [Polyplax serrata]|uniref:Phorbol-ester/DAG-type domain-containing protein n=1 Tax=Polyplax serrata TaxID=468196 RepID=A0AAN8SBI7_POLSC
MEEDKHFPSFFQTLLTEFYLSLFGFVIEYLNFSGADSDEDIITDYLSESDRTGPPMTNNIGGPGPLVPIISVTPHSPGSKHYLILDENLQHLHRIHDTIQQMRHVIGFNGSGGLNLRLNQSSRLSSSCPSLNDGGSDPELFTNSNSTPTHGTSKGSSKQWLVSKGVLDADLNRRRSWTALEDLTSGKGLKTCRQRSMSLSSLDSEQDDPFSDQQDGGSTSLLVTAGKAVGITGRRSNRNNGGASTHSLNEADLQNDFNVIIAKRQMENMPHPSPPHGHLHKSVSTPSIIAVRDIVPEVTSEENTVMLPVCQLRPSGTESETEEEVIHTLMDTTQHYVVDMPPNSQMHLHQLFEEAYDGHSEKRRKRGSLFFRKKKDKVKKTAHQWVSVSYGFPYNCDSCSKSLNNKPALYCDNCTKRVHSSSCKDQVSECVKAKSSKTSSKPQSLTKRSSSSQPSGSSNRYVHPHTKVSFSKRFQSVGVNAGDEN